MAFVEGPSRVPINKREHVQSSGYYAVVIRNMKGDTVKMTDKGME